MCRHFRKRIEQKPSFREENKVVAHSFSILLSLPDLFHSICFHIIWHLEGRVSNFSNYSSAKIACWKKKCFRGSNHIKCLNNRSLKYPLVFTFATNNADSKNAVIFAMITLWVTFLHPKPFLSDPMNIWINCFYNLNPGSGKIVFGLGL